MRVSDPAPQPATPSPSTPCRCERPNEARCRQNHALRAWGRHTLCHEQEWESLSVSREPASTIKQALELAGLSIHTPSAPTFPRSYSCRPRADSALPNRSLIHGSQPAPVHSRLSHMSPVTRHDFGHVCLQPGLLPRVHLLAALDLSRPRGESQAVQQSTKGWQTKVSPAHAGLQRHCTDDQLHQPPVNLVSPRGTHRYGSPIGCSSISVT